MSVHYGMSGAHGGLKRALNPLELELWMVYGPPCGCWESNLGLLQEQQIFLTSDPSLQSQFQSFIEQFLWVR